MLNDQEQRQLDAIEEALLLDARLSTCFLRKWPASPRRAWGPRWLILPGALIMMVSIVLALEGPFAQGLGLVVVGLIWSAVTGGLPRRILKFLLDPGDIPPRSAQRPER